MLERVLFPFSQRLRGCSGEVQQFTRFGPSVFIRRTFKSWQTHASRPPAYEEEQKVKRTGFKIVVENRNVYEGQYIQVTHVVHDRPEAATTTSSFRRTDAVPGWMRQGQVGAPRRRNPATFQGRLLA